MAVPHEHEKTIHAGIDPVSAGEPVHKAVFLRLQGLDLNQRPPGFERVRNTTKRIQREAKSRKGLREGARGGVRLQRETTPTDGPSDETARRMRREVLRLQQQMAFFKKVMKLHDKPEP